VIITITFQSFAFRVHSKGLFFLLLAPSLLPELYNWAVHQRIIFNIVKFKIINLRYKTLNYIQWIKHSKLNVT